MNGPRIFSEGVSVHDWKMVHDVPKDVVQALGNVPSAHECLGVWRPAAVGQLDGWMAKILVWEISDYFTVTLPK